jgi:hypothetical protein
MAKSGKNCQMVGSAALPLGTLALLVVVGRISFEADFLWLLSLIGRRFAERIGLNPDARCPAAREKT